MKKEAIVIINEMQSNEKKVIVKLMAGKKKIAEIGGQKIFVEKIDDKDVYSIFSGPKNTVEQCGLESFNQAVRIACETEQYIKFKIGTNQE